MRKRTFTAALLAGLTLGAHAQAQVSDDVVRIGVLTDMSGPYASVTGAGSIEAAKIAVEEFGGTILGKKIEIISADHQNKVDLGSSLASKWIDVEKVDVITDVVNSSVALSVQELAKNKNRIVLQTASATSALTGKACSPTGLHWTFDTYSLANTTAGAMVKAGHDTWYFLTADYSFGHALEADASNAVIANGGKVLGAVKHPFPSTDLSSFLLRAQSSKAKVIGMANGVADTVNAMKQASEFGIIQSGQQIAALLVGISDIRAMGLQTAQGLVLTEAFYWDLDDRSRAFAKKYADRMGGAMPSQVHAGNYSAVRHYLKAVQAANTDETNAVLKKMREMPVDDAFARNGKIRPDGRMVHDMYLLQVKKPSESKGPWDVYKVVRVVPGDEAYLPLEKSTCPLVKKG